MDKRGMSLITLTVTIAILMLIASVVVVSGISSVESAKKTSFAIELKNIQEIVDEYISKTDEPIPIIKTITLNTSGVDSDVIIAQFSDEEIDANILKLDVIDLFKLGIKDIKYGKGETSLDYYAISNTTNKVYYPAGIKAGGKVFYTLTSELNKVLGRNDFSATTKKAVAFEGAPNKWTSTAVQIKVKIPEEYTVNSITATESVVISTSSLITNPDGTKYNLYTVNTTNIIKNYTITVVYTDNSTEKTAIYKVSKVDGTSPSISNPEQKHNIDTATNIATAYITGINVTDSESGVKTVKYIKGTLTDDVNLKEFFAQYGEVLNNNIQIEQGATSYTIYAEDNSGNIKVINVAISDYIKSILW